jgi:hypothetical protein
MKEKIIFNKDTIERLGSISFKLLQFMNNEIEKLDLNERDKIAAHYLVIRNYMDGIKEALGKMGINDVIIEYEKKEDEKK